MTNLEKMGKFIGEVETQFMVYPDFKYPMPRPRITLGYDDEKELPDDRLVDAHWKEKEFELLLSLEEGTFCFYGDNYGAKAFKHSDATPQNVAEAIYLLRKA